MPRTPATEEQKAAVRAKIRAAAIDLYRQNGLTNITARAIAVRAEVSVGTIYAHFGSLAELMQSLWKKPVERFEARLKSTVEAHDKPLDKIEALLQEYLRFARNNPELYRASFLFVRPASVPSPAQQALEESALMQLLVNALAEGQRTGEVRQDDPRRLAQLLWAALHGAIALPINIDRFEFDAEKHLTTGMLDLVLRAIKPE